MSAKLATQCPAPQRRARAKTLRTCPYAARVTARLVAAMLTAGVSQPQLSAALGVGSSTVGRWCSPHDETTMPSHQRERLRDVMPRLWAALVRAEQATLPDGPTIAKCPTALTLAAAEHEGAFRGHLMRSLADGRIDRNEARELLRIAGRVERSWRATVAAIASKVVA